MKKHIVVIGAAGLLGKEVARCLLAEGNNVVLSDINLDALEAVRKELDQNNINTFVQNVNITSQSSIDELIVSATKHFGEIDSVVNCAYPRNDQYGVKVEEVSYSSFCENVNLHLGGYFLTCQRFALALKEQGHGHVINLASIYGVVAPKFEVYNGTEMTMPVEYSAIKSGIIQLTRYFAQYFKASKVRFNSVSPGGIYYNQPDKFTNQYGAHSLSGGLLSPEEVARVICFLISDDGKAINGQNIIVDDGWTL